MIATKPLLSKDFEASIVENAKYGVYRTNIQGLEIDVFPYVFPPKSPFSESTHTVYDQFGDLTGQKVLDIGTGTGIQAFQAILSGALYVDAVDISEIAVECAKHNAKLNKLEDKIKIWKSDLFENIKENKYDLIIANLPIVDVDESDIRLHSLYDPSFSYHERLFDKTPDYLSNNGKIVLCHANLQENAFNKLEDMARQHNFSFNIKQSVNVLEYEWRNYEFKFLRGNKI